MLGSSCIRCPFGVEANSVDVVALLLLQKVDKTVSTKSILMYESLHFEDIDHHNAYDGHFSTVSTKSIDTDIRFTVDQNTMPAVPLEKKSDANSNHTVELLLLLELVANVAGWEFTQDKIVPQLLKIFKSCASYNTSAGVMVLIGQLGRIGVVARGYDGVGVNTLRSKLCDLVRQISASYPSFTVQANVLNALLSLLPLNLAHLIQNSGETLTSVSQSVAACSIRKWYCSLSRERQVLAHNILQSTASDK